MLETISSAFSFVVGVILWAVTMPVQSFFGYGHAPEETPYPPSTISSGDATSTAHIAPVEVTEPTSPPTPVAAPVLPVPPPPANEDPEVRTVGKTTLAVQSIPLLSGGTVHAGESVPVAYLQITNIGSNGTVLTGFWVTQYGSASVESVIGLSTVDDKGGSRGSVVGSDLFEDDVALAPTDAYFAPGQMRLFTIKANVTDDIQEHRGTTLMLDLTGLETDATVRDEFPIEGTTWTIQ